MVAPEVKALELSGVGSSVILGHGHGHRESRGRLGWVESQREGVLSELAREGGRQGRGRESQARECHEATGRLKTGSNPGGTLLWL